jgi:hypothetical protein
VREPHVRMKPMVGVTEQVLIRSQAGGSHARSTWRGYMNMPPLTPIVCPVM